jgi:hypothetical protein
MLVKHVYGKLSARYTQTVLATMHGNVIWANGMESGNVSGRERGAEVGRHWGR